MKALRLAPMVGLAAALAACAGPNVRATGVAPVTPPLAW